MPRSVDSLSRRQARRLALAATGLHRSRPTGRVDRRHMRRVMDTLGVIQLDSVNVMTRTHYMPFWSRLGAYDMDLFDRMAGPGGEWIECWTHEASVIPATDHPRWVWQAERARAGHTWPRLARVANQRPDLLDQLLGTIADEGAITAGQIDDPTHRNAPWWGWGDVKSALEWLYRSGRLAAFRRGNFVRWYDLPERVVPEEVLAREPLTEHEALRSLLLSSADHLGVATQTDLSDYFRLPKVDARAVTGELVEDGLLRQVEVEGWRQQGLVRPDVTIPRRQGATALVSPFDPLVWCRERAERIFGFEYRIEIYVPAHERRHGYYVLPFLLDGELVARVDLKADRAAAALLVQSAWIEPGRDEVAVADALAAELAALADWRELARVEVADRGDLAPSLRRAVVATSADPADV